MKSFVHHFLLLLAVSMITVSMMAAEEFVVVIDAGHGGKDPGAQSAGRKVNEKDIALAVALRTGELIHKNHPEVKVIYTRKTDTFVTLNGRADIANKAKADLFISIHCNAAESRKAYGAEVFVLGTEENRTSANLNAAKRENSVILLEKDYQKTYQGFDPNSPESYIIFEYLQSEYLKESIELAQCIQKQLISTAKRSDRGVHQAGFLVLHATSMPSILVELGFISNGEEEKFLHSADGKEKLSKSLSNGFTNYYNSLKKDTQKAGEEKKNGNGNGNWNANGNGNVNGNSKAAGNASSKADSTPAKTDAAPSKADSTPAKTDSTPAKTDTPAKADSTPAKTEASSKKTDADAAANANANAEVDDNAIVFKVQFLFSAEKLPANSAKFKGLSDVSYYEENGTYKYTCGNTTSLDEISKLKKTVAQTYKDAFIVAFRGGKRINTTEAINEYKASH